MTENPAEKRIQEDFRPKVYKNLADARKAEAEHERRIQEMLRRIG